MTKLIPGARSAIFFFAIFGFILMYLILKEENSNNKKFDEQIVQLYKQEISGVVSSISQNRGTLKMILSSEGSNSIYYFLGTRNYNLNPYNLNDFLQPGDSIFKPSNSNDLFIFREENKYYFVLGKSINKAP